MSLKKLEIGPHESRRTPDGFPAETWDTLDSSYRSTWQAKWGAGPLPIADNVYDWVHASHVLEHVPWWETRSAIREVLRILRPGGVFTVWVPDALEIIRLATEEPDEFLRRERDWPCGGLNPQQDLWTYMNARVFWGARPGERGQEQHFHRAMFGEDSLKSLLREAGFEEVRRISRNVGVDPGHGWMEVGVRGQKPEVSEI